MTTSAAYLANGGYPGNWKEIARYRREVVVGNQCEWMEADDRRCERRHGEPITGNESRKVVLSVSHLISNAVNHCIFV